MRTKFIFLVFFLGFSVHCQLFAEGCLDVWRYNFDLIHGVYNNDVEFCKTQGFFSGRCLLEAEAAYAKGVDIAGDIFYTCEE